jgi:hypothetical protein
MAFTKYRFFFFFTGHLKGTVEWGIQGVKSLGLGY